MVVKYIKKKVLKNGECKLVQNILPSWPVKSQENTTTEL